MCTKNIEIRLDKIITNHRFCFGNFLGKVWSQWDNYWIYRLLLDIILLLLIIISIQKSVIFTALKVHARRGFWKFHSYVWKIARIYMKNHLRCISHFSQNPNCLGRNAIQRFCWRIFKFACLCRIYVSIHTYIPKKSLLVKHQKLQSLLCLENRGVEHMVKIRFIYLLLYLIILKNVVLFIIGLSQQIPYVDVSC